MIGTGEVSKENIAANAVDTSKILSGGNSKVLTTADDGTVTWVAQNTIKPTGADLTTDGIITIEGGEDDGKTGAGVLLADTKISIKNESIGIEKLAESKAENMVLTTGADKKPVWVAQNTIKPTGADLTTDGIITIEGGEDDGKTGAGVLLTDAKISIKDESIGIEKLVESKAENMVLTTGADKKPVWESKYTTITSTPVETKEVIDGKKVFTLKIANGKVTKASDAIDYNTIIDPILIDNIDYLLSAQIFNKTNSLLVSNVTDVVNTKDTSVQFRFGSNNMYSTLPAGTEYVVILKYVSTVAAD
ncbi:hypothetical protein NWE55_04275 [Myroides albus]|uniref:hypothetical protein n=1 Tax=Myroides albus TaxID=2562892 RepID=UPI002158A584|nr:hypothetical protein [Myroides albus]UVD80494.1 hypothetical protein NWE55_04275 [Myroides albus]